MGLTFDREAGPWRTAPGRHVLSPEHAPNATYKPRTTLPRTTGISACIEQSQCWGLTSEYGLQRFASSTRDAEKGLRWEAVLGALCSGTPWAPAAPGNEAHPRAPTTRRTAATTTAHGLRRNEVMASPACFPHSASEETIATAIQGYGWQMRALHRSSSKVSPGGCGRQFLRESVQHAWRAVERMNAATRGRKQSPRCSMSSSCICPPMHALKRSLILRPFRNMRSGRSHAVVVAFGSPVNLGRCSASPGVAHRPPPHLPWAWPASDPPRSSPQALPCAGGARAQRARPPHAPRRRAAAWTPARGTPTCRGGGGGRGAAQRVCDAANKVNRLVCGLSAGRPVAPSRSPVVTGPCRRELGKVPLHRPPPVRRTSTPTLHFA